MLDAFERSLNVLDINCYHCCMVRVVVPLGQAAVDGAWFCGHLCLLVDFSCVDHVVLHSRVLVDVPAEGLLVEALGAFYIIGGYFEVYYSAVRHDFFTRKDGPSGLLHKQSRRSALQYTYSLYKLSWAAWSAV